MVFTGVVIDERAIGEWFRALAGTLDERQRRVWAAAEARSHGRGGIAAVARASGLAENTIRKGLRDLDAPGQLPVGRVRKAGAGPKRRTDTDLTLLLARIHRAGRSVPSGLDRRMTS